MDPLKIAAVEKILNYKFKDKRLLEEALTHSSWDKNMSYERLEFLGDAALGLMVATHFFRLEQKLNSEDLTELRKKCVSNEKLALVAAKHGLYRFVRSKNTVAFDPDVTPREIWADIVESLAGAVYLDVNFDLPKLSMIFEDVLMVDEISLPEVEEDDSSVINGAQDKLYGLCGKRKWSNPSYRLVKAEPCQHKMKYVYSVAIETDNGVLSEEGCEKSALHDARNSAAYHLLRTMQETSARPIPGFCGGAPPSQSDGRISGSRAPPQDPDRFGSGGSRTLPPDSNRLGSGGGSRKPEPWRPSRARNPQRG
ncbi:hypothetical protein PTKIN_Ptkin11bG0186100 [Pterospermum kingtungense]